MKSSILFLLMILSSICWSQDISITQKNAYYYCLSRTINETENENLGFVMYTDIHEIALDTTIIKEKSNEWYKFVVARCKSVKGCSSDLNYYKSVEQAEATRNKYLEKYRNSNKYKIEKVEFN